MMRCLEARQLFSAHLDGELALAKAGVLRAHLVGCRECAADFALEQALSAALRECAAPDPLTWVPRLTRPAPLAQVPGAGAPSGYPRVPRAPEGFARSVTAAIEERRRGRRPGWFGGWRPALAAAAASLLIAAGALGYGAQQWLNRGPVVAINPPAPHGQQLDPAGGGAEPGQTGVDRPGGGGPAAVEPGDLPGGAPGTKEAGAPEGTGDGAGTEREPGGVQVAAGPDLEPKVFLNKPRTISTTFIRLNVLDLAETRSKAIAAAADAGAPYQVQGAQAGASSETLRFDVDPARADGFVTRLGELGLVAHRQSDQWEITAQFATSLEEYQALIGRRELAAGPDERAALDEEIAALERRLTEWNQVAEQHIVVLMLQQN